MIVVEVSCYWLKALKTFEGSRAINYLKRRLILRKYMNANFKRNMNVREKDYTKFSLERY